MPDASDGSADTLTDLFVRHCHALRAWLEAGTGAPPPELAAALVAWRATHPQTDEAFERTLTQGARYVGLVEELLRLGAAGQRSETDDGDWRRLIDRLREPLFGGPATDGGWLPVWQTLLDQLPAAWAGLAPWFQTGASGPSLADELHRGLRLPGIAPHASNALWQGLASAWQAYVAAEIDYRALLDAAARTAAGRLRAAVCVSPPPTVRALYDCWVEESESVWVALIREDRYAAAQARLVHALLHCRRASQQLAADLGRSFDLPTRAEVDTLAARLHDTRRHQQALAGELAALRAELVALAARDRNTTP